MFEFALYVGVFLLLVITILLLVLVRQIHELLDRAYVVRLDDLVRRVEKLEDKNSDL